jgi:CRP-like cAMP-binding protein
MTASELSALVRKVRPPLLEGLTLPEFGSVLAGARQQRFLANSVISNQGHPANHLYMVLSGGARSFFLTSGGQKVFIHWYPPGDVFGGMALISRPSSYLVSTETVKNSLILMWDRKSIRRLAARYPKLTDNALTIASNYLNLAIATQVSLSCHTARQRLAAVLVNLAGGIGHEVPGGIELAIRNEEMAAAANITPFTASRIISDWERSSLIKKSRGKLFVSSPERLLLKEV